MQHRARRPSRLDPIFIKRVHANNGHYGEAGVIAAIAAGGAALLTCAIIWYVMGVCQQGIDVSSANCYQFLL